MSSDGARFVDGLDGLEGEGDAHGGDAAAVLVVFAVPHELGHGGHGSLLLGCWYGASIAQQRCVGGWGMGDGGKCKQGGGVGGGGGGGGGVGDGGMEANAG